MPLRQLPDGRRFHASRARWAPTPCVPWLVGLTRPRGASPQAPAAKGAQQPVTHAGPPDASARASSFDALDEEDLAALLELLADPVGNVPLLGWRRGSGWIDTDAAASYLGPTVHAVGKFTAAGKTLFEQAGPDTSAGSTDRSSTSGAGASASPTSRRCRIATNTGEAPTPQGNRVDRLPMLTWLPGYGHPLVSKQRRSRVKRRLTRSQTRRSAGVWGTGGRSDRKHGAQSNCVGVMNGPTNMARAAPLSIGCLGRVVRNRGAHSRCVVDAASPVAAGHR